MYIYPSLLSIYLIPFVSPPIPLPPPPLTSPSLPLPPSHLSLSLPLPSLSHPSLPLSGVDFFSRAIMLNEKVVSLQLWDTAGQERYSYRGDVRLCSHSFVLHLLITLSFLYSLSLSLPLPPSLPPSPSPRFQSVTRAYYRGANGVILMYDITQEDTFIAVKTWINSIQVNCHTHYIKPHPPIV